MGWLSRSGAALLQLQKAVTLLTLVLAQSRDVRSENKGTWLCVISFLSPVVLLHLVDGPPNLLSLLLQVAWGNMEGNRRLPWRKKSGICALIWTIFLADDASALLSHVAPSTKQNLLILIPELLAGLNMRLTTT